MLPPTPQPPPTHRTPAWAVVLLCGLGLLIAGTAGELVRSLWTLPQIDAASTSLPPSASAPSSPAYDATASAALAQLAVAFSTSVAPTMTAVPPTATYAVATAIPNTVCGTWVPLGHICEQPLPPKPSPTAIPDCPVAPRELCVWRGSLGEPVTPVNAGSPWRAS